MPPQEKFPKLPPQEEEKLQGIREALDNYLRPRPESVMQTWRKQQPDKQLPGDKKDFPVELSLNVRNVPNYNWKAQLRDKDDYDTIKSTVINRYGIYEVACNEPGGTIKITNDGVKIDNTIVSFPDILHGSSLEAHRNMLKKHSDDKQPELLKTLGAQQKVTASEANSLLWDWPKEEHGGQTTTYMLSLPHGGSTIDLSEHTDPERLVRIILTSGSNTRTIIGNAKGVQVINLTPDTWNSTHTLSFPAERAEGFWSGGGNSPGSYIYLRTCL